MLQLTTSTTMMAKDGPRCAARSVAFFFQTQKRHHPSRKAKYFCPHCHKALYRWKEQTLLTIYKCANDHCPAFLTALNKLNASEKQLQKKKLSQFKLRYQYREYHFQPSTIKHSAPDKPKINLDRIHHRSDILGLVLAFHISCAITARKTAFILRNVFNVPISYQTVLNYAESAAYHCHLFNLQRKGPIDPISSADETYIKIRGKHHFVFFFISTKSLKITAYHLADNREVLPATIAMTEAIRTAPPDQKLTFITDGNPSYAAAIHFLNALRDPLPPLTHHKVIGLQNLDEESTEFRLYKQIIERLNRTYKSHVRPTHGFNVRNGAMALTTLFVTHYNFLRPHMTLNYNVPIPLPELDSITTLQGKWMKILSMAIPSAA
jgi:putative transposase